MNKEEHSNLVEIGKTYIGKEISIRIPDHKNLKKNIVVKHVITNILPSIGFSEDGGEMKFKSPICVTKSENGNIVQLSLTEIITNS